MQGFLWCLTKVMVLGQVLFLPMSLVGIFLAALMGGRAMDRMGGLRVMVYLGVMSLLGVAMVWMVVDHILKWNSRQRRYTEKRVQWMWMQIGVAGLCALIVLVVVFDVLLNTHVFRIGLGMLLLLYVLLGVVSGGMMMSHRVMKGMEIEKGCCRECGYDLRGTIAAGRDVCPECGAACWDGCWE